MFNIVKDFLATKMGQEIEVVCDAASITGKVTKLENNVLFLEKDEVTCFVNIDKIVVVWDKKGKGRKSQPPGFRPIIDEFM